MKKAWDRIALNYSIDNYKKCNFMASEGDRRAQGHTQSPDRGGGKMNHAMMDTMLYTASLP
jgi:hypothetical protein